MAEPERQSAQPQWMRGLLFALGLLAIFAFRIAGELPMLLDYRDFAFRDVGSFENVNRLLDIGLKPSIDFGFSYGLLGLAVQRIAFAIFGASHWTTLGCTLLFLLFILAFWWLLAREFGFSWWSLAILTGLCAMTVGLAETIPTAAHALLRALLVYSLYFVLKGRLRIALALAALAALALPSLPIVLAGMIFCAIVLQWLQRPERRFGYLAGQIAPAIAVYLLAAMVLGAMFGARSVAASLLPTQGVSLYRAMNFGFFGGYRLFSGQSFWLPQSPSVEYYLFNKAGIWLFCTASLIAFGAIAVVRMVRAMRAEGVPLFVFFCCALHLFFIFFAFGSAASSVYYEYILVAGVVAGAAVFLSGRPRTVLCILILVFGLLSNRTGFSKERAAWGSWRRAPETMGFYAPRSFKAEWDPILSLADSRSLLLLAYGNGVSSDYPRIGTPHSWFLLPGLVLPPENAYVLGRIASCDVVVEYIAAPRLYIEGNAQWQAALSQFPGRVKGKYFRVYLRNKADAETLATGSVYRVEEAEDNDAPPE